ncbi:POC1 centriolar protein homolog A-like [Aricia agestis]|uniref:POC1 centriolar protein homolog A-like n=1 Tax=Aricia agestis TaxID=91739 RepID=UPI001C206EB5|nr:POC1 centriolar protein homolog A-like [Aricia agestis]
MELKNTSLEPSLEKQLKGHRNSITALFYNPNELQLASSSLDNSVLLWDLRGNMRSYRFQGHSEAVTDVTFSPSGKYMASASRDKTIRLWVPTVTGSTGVFKAHSQTVRSVQFSPDGTKILTASDDKIIKLWSSNKHKFIASYVGHTNWVRRANMSPDGTLIASCSDDKTTRIWNPETGDCIHTFKDQKGYGHYLSWHPSSCYVAVGTSHGNVKLYDVRTHNLVQYYSIHDDAVTQLTFHPSGSYILTASKDGKMRILDLLEGHPIFTLIGHEGSINSVSFSPSGSGFASAGDDKLGVKAWYQCYHSSKYPTVTFDYVNEPLSPSVGLSNVELQNNSTRNQNNFIRSSTPINTTKTLERDPHIIDDISTNDVGDMSHIPRVPPSPMQLTSPSLMHKTIDNDEKELFGMIKLGDSDVCYTSGTIQWVGRKRCFPLNSGFKILAQNQINEPDIKKKKNSLKNNMECECADVLPTVSAIVDHLNALHEAVDLVDLRLNTIEQAIDKN